MLYHTKLICFSWLIISSFSFADTDTEVSSKDSCHCPSCAYIESVCVQTVTDDGWMPFMSSNFGALFVLPSHCAVISKPSPYRNDGSKIYNWQCADDFPEKFINPEGCMLVTRNEPDNVDGKSYKLECNETGAAQAVTEFRTKLRPQHQINSK